MASKQFGIPTDEQKLLVEKHKRRLALRNEFIKQTTNPHRHATGEGGFLFDTGIQRFQAMRVSNFEHFKPTGRSFRTGLFSVALPIIIYTWMIKSERDQREAKVRAGLVSYRDRKFKFI